MAGDDAEPRVHADVQRPAQALGLAERQGHPVPAGLAAQKVLRAHQLAELLRGCGSPREAVEQRVDGRPITLVLIGAEAEVAHDPSQFGLAQPPTRLHIVHVHEPIEALLLCLVERHPRCSAAILRRGRASAIGHPFHEDNEVLEPAVR